MTQDGWVVGVALLVGVAAYVMRRSIDRTPGETHTSPQRLPGRLAAVAVVVVVGAILGALVAHQS